MIRFLMLAVALQRCLAILASPLATPFSLSMPFALHNRPNTTVLIPSTTTPSNGTNPLPPMPSTDIIIALNTHLAILINYNPDRLLPDSDTVTVISEALSRIPAGAAGIHAIPDRLMYSAGNVFLSLFPQTPRMLWTEWYATLKGLLWFREQYTALAMKFETMDTLHGMEIIGSGMLGGL